MGLISVYGVYARGTLYTYQVVFFRVRVFFFILYVKQIELWNDGSSHRARNEMRDPLAYDFPMQHRSFQIVHCIDFWSVSFARENEHLSKIETDTASVQYAAELEISFRVQLAFV